MRYTGNEFDVRRTTAAPYQIAPAMSMQNISIQANHDFKNLSLMENSEHIICDTRQPRTVSPAELVACVIAVLTVIENIVILMAILRGHRSLRKPPYWFIASLAVADLLTGVEVVLAVFVPIGSSPLIRIVLKVGELNF